MNIPYELFQTIQGFLQSAYMRLSVMCLKTEWLFHIHFLFYYTIQESSLDIHRISHFITATRAGTNLMEVYLVLDTPGTQREGVNLCVHSLLLFQF